MNREQMADVLRATSGIVDDPVESKADLVDGAIGKPLPVRV
jgi:hypothetical protein